MGLLSFLHRHRLVPSWTFSPGGVIWRLLISRDGRIVGEDRDVEKKTVRFFCLDGRSGAILWSGVTLEEPWWTGIEAIQGNLVILHGFAKPDMPDHQGMHVLDLATGERLWSRADVTFQFGYKDRLYAARTNDDGMKLIVLDAGRGEVLEELSDDSVSIAALRSLSRSEEGDDNLEYAESLTPSEAGNVAAEDAPPIPRDTVGNVEVLRVGERVVIGWYVQAPPIKGSSRLHHHLIVHSRTGGTEFETIVHNDARVPLPDTFFVHGGTLFFIRQERTLEAVPLLDAK